MLIAKEGFPFILFFAALLALAIGFRWLIPAAIVLILLLFVVYFFRDPVRTPVLDPNVMLAAADGKIVQIKKASIDGQSCWQVVTFLSPLNVHINRIPYSGTVRSTDYTPGIFLAAYKPECETENQRLAMTLDTPIGIVRVVQITGFLARRIVCRVKTGEAVTQGSKYGLIKFGSRTDVYFPDSFDVAVSVGQHVEGGLTQIAVKRP